MTTKHNLIMAVMILSITAGLIGYVRELDLHSADLLVERVSTIVKWIVVQVVLVVLIVRELWRLLQHAAE